MAEEIIGRVRQFKEKVNDNYHVIEDLYNKELKTYLTHFESKDHTPEDCDILIGVLNEALAEVETKTNKSLMMVKDGLKQAKIDALEKKMKHCTCQDVPLRKDSKKPKERPKAWVDSGISDTSSTDSRVMSELGDAPVVQPTDAPEDKEKHNRGNDVE